MVPVEKVFDNTAHFKLPRYFGGLKATYYCPRCKTEMVSYFTAKEKRYLHTCECGVVFHGLEGKKSEVS